MGVRNVTRIKKYNKIIQEPEPFTEEDLQYIKNNEGLDEFDLMYIIEFNIYSILNNK